MLMFVKLFRPKSDQTFKVKTSEPSAEINEMNSTSADKDEQEANLTQHLTTQDTEVADKAVFHKFLMLLER